MNLIDKIQTLLRADMINESYYLMMEEFVRYFSTLNNMNISQKDITNKEILEKIFRALCWKMIENYSTEKEHIYRLKELRYDLVFEKDKEKLLVLYKECGKIYEELKKGEIKKKKINIAEELKILTQNENYRLAVDILEQIFFANKFRIILNKYKIEYEWYLDCEELSYKIQLNIEELIPYVENIGYEGGGEIKYKLERLIDDIKYIDEII